MYAAVSAFFPWFHTSLKVFKHDSLQHHLQFLVGSLQLRQIVSKWFPFSCNFSLGNRSHKGNVRWLGWVENYYFFFFPQTSRQHCFIVMMKNSLCSLPLDICSQSSSPAASTFLWQFAQDSLWTIPYMLKTNQCRLHCLWTWHACFGFSQLWEFLLWLLLCIRFITTDLWFITSYNLGDEGGIISYSSLTSCKLQVLCSVKFAIAK